MSSPSDETVVADTGIVLAQYGRRLADGLVPLDLLGSDVEEADRGILETQHGAPELRSHDRELDQIVGIALDIRAEVEHHALAAVVGKDRRDRGAVDAGQGLQRELRHRHQRAGIAGRDDAFRLAVADRVDCQPHARPLPLAQRLGRFVVVGDYFSV